MGSPEWKIAYGDCKNYCHNFGYVCIPNNTLAVDFSRGRLPSGLPKPLRITAPSTSYYDLAIAIQKYQIENNETTTT